MVVMLIQEDRVSDSMVTVNAGLDTAKVSIKHTKSCCIQVWHSITTGKSLGADVFKIDEI